MSIDFKQVIHRDNTNAVKWDAREQLFGRDDVLPMWVADMDFLTVPELKDEIVKRAQHDIYGYTSYDEELIDSIAQWLKEHHQYPINRNFLSFSPGVIPSLHALVQAFTDVGDSIVIQPPVYPPFFSVIESHGREIMENPLIYEEGYYKMNFDQLEDCFKKGAKAFILCSPHNPIGRVWTREELEQVADLCVKYNVYIFSDEIHHDIVYSDSNHLVTSQINDQIAELTFSLMAPSKTFNIAGLQASYVVSPNEEAKKALDDQLLRQGIMSLNIFGYIAMKTVYKHGQSWLEQLLRQLEENRNETYRRITQANTPIKATKPEGTYLMWLDFTETQLEHEKIKEKLIHEAKVGLNDGLTFGKQGEKFMRLNFATPPSLLDEGITRILKTFSS